jgi:DNA-directed RNA polymerase specialized sigma24 family protein
VVWAGLDDEFMDGQILVGKEVGRMLKILDRKVSNYFRSRGTRPIKQPSLSNFDHNDIENLKSALAPPYQEAIQQEQLRLIDAKLSELPSHMAEAVRSRFGFPGAPKWAEFIQASGTTRQNVTKLVSRALKKLKLVLPDSLHE